MKSGLIAKMAQAQLANLRCPFDSEPVTIEGIFRSEKMKDIFLLLVIYQIKHFLADYPLQNGFMLGKFKTVGWVKPLSAHCGVHALLTFIIAIFFINYEIAFCLAVFDFNTHFIMDRIKASPKLLGRYESISKQQFKGLSESRAMCVNALDFFIDNEPNKSIREESKSQIKEIDRKFKGNKLFWWALGLDQMVHHLTHYVIIYFLVS